MKPVILNNAIILTGGIATGKSSVAKILKKYGYDVIDSDEIAHEALEIKQDEIIEHFGDEILDSGCISRPLLGRIVFSSQESKKALEAILHPYIFDEIVKRATFLEQKRKVYFLDIPLYFETKKRYLGREIWCVASNEKIQLERLMLRNNLSRQDALARINAQMPLGEKLKESDVIIKNNSTLEELEHRVKDQLKLIR